MSAIELLPPESTPAAPLAAALTLAISNHGLRNGGGIERYAMTVVRGLHERGVRPTVIAKAFDAALPEYGFVKPVRAGVSLVPGKLRDLVFDWRIGRAKRRLGLFPLIACNQTRWSDIGICGSTHPGYLAAMGLPTRRSDRWKIELERAHLERSKVVVAHSARMRDEAVRHYGIDAGKVELLYPPVDGEKFSPADAARRSTLRSIFGLPSKRAVFLLASTGHKRKGLELLATHFARTKLPITLAVVGRAPDGPMPNVHYLGYRADIENAYRAADFTVVASHYEPFGLVGVESVLCGTSVLLADNVGCAEVIRAPASIGFSLDDPASLERAISEATYRWNTRLHRLERPLESLAYDPSVETHVDALLALAARLGARADGD